MTARDADPPAVKLEDEATPAPEGVQYGARHGSVGFAGSAKQTKRSGANPTEQVDSLFRVVLSRTPAAEEASWSVNYLQRHPDGLWQVAQALLLSNEFQFTE